jgi:nitroreductase
MLALTPDELLTTTRACRKRLDFSTPVPAELVRECVAAALQAPSGSNHLTMRFVVVTDAGKRAAIGEIYRQCYDSPPCDPTPTP